MLVGVEMDEKRMTPFLFNGLPIWAVVLSLAAHFAAGAALGVLYFRCLWWNVRQLTGGGRAATVFILAVGRFILLAALLTLASRKGAPPLLAVALGLFAARYMIMRGFRESAP